MLSERKSEPSVLSPSIHLQISPAIAAANVRIESLGLLVTSKPTELLHPRADIH